MNVDGAYAWRKSARCGDTNCLEIAELGSAVAIRNSATPAAVLLIPGPGFAALVRQARSGDLDLTHD